VQSSSQVIFFSNSFRQISWNLTPKDIYQFSAAEGKSTVIVEKTVDGERSKVEGADTIKIGEAFEGEILFSLPKENRIFGLGQHENGIFDYRGQKEYLVQNNMKIPMSVFLCVGPTDSYAVLFDAGCLMTFEEMGGTARVAFDAVHSIDYYVIEGQSMDELIQEVRWLTGTAVMLPRWAFGYMQSKERYKTQAEVIKTAEKFKELDIPVSCLVQDWSTWEKGKWGQKSPDKERFPDIKTMISRLHDMGITYMLSIWPNPAVSTEDNKELGKIGGILANASTYDAFNEEARELYWKQCQREWYSAGTDAWWCDSTEPFTPDWTGAVKKTDIERYQLSKEVLTKYLDARDANHYALAHAQGIYENQRKADGTKRVVNLTRSGSIGVQKYGAILWSGDITATWETLRNQITEGLNMSASGIPYWTVDIGAFFTGSCKCWQNWIGSTEKETPWFWSGHFEDGVADMGYRELYVRWLQFGAFLPIMRSHGTDTPREPWHFGKPGDIFYDTIIKYIRLRYRLMPYIYSVAWMVTNNGYTMMRNLNFDFPGDSIACAISDQYMFGPAFMVCPVTQPMYYEAGSIKINKPQTRKVYLPSGGWYDYETKEYFQGGGWLTVKAPLESMPLYVRAGSIIPADKVIEIYEGVSTAFILYNDNGKDYTYEDGNYSAISLYWNDTLRELKITKIEGNYPNPENLRLRIYLKNGDIKDATQ